MNNKSLLFAAMGITVIGIVTLTANVSLFHADRLQAFPAVVATDQNTVVEYVPKYEREPTAPVVVEEIETSILTPLGLFDSDTYPETCYPTEENFRERYSRSLRDLWNTPVSAFLNRFGWGDLQDFDQMRWMHQMDRLIHAPSSDMTVGAALSFPNGVDFESRLTAVWETDSTQSLYQRHMEIIEISSWTASVQYQGDIDYVAELNDDMLDHIRYLIWDSDSDLAFLYAVQQHAENQYE